MANGPNGSIWKSRISKSLFKKSSSFEVCLPSEVVFHRRLSSIKGRFLSKVVFCRRSSSIQWLSSIKSCLPSRVIFHQRSFSIKACLPSKVFFHQRLSSIKGNLPSEVPFIKARLPLKEFFRQISSVYVHNYRHVVGNGVILRKMYSSLSTQEHIWLKSSRTVILIRRMSPKSLHSRTSHEVNIKTVTIQQQ